MKLAFGTGHAAADSAVGRQMHEVQVASAYYFVETRPDGAGHWYRCAGIVGWTHGSREDALESFRAVVTEAA